jgi:hypothetical protein
MGRRADDHGLGQRRGAAAHAVELAAIGIGAAENGQKDALDRAAVGRQIARMKEYALARATAVEGSRNPGLAHGASQRRGPETQSGHAAGRMPLSR